MAVIAASFSQHLFLSRIGRRRSLEPIPPLLVTENYSNDSDESKLLQIVRGQGRILSYKVV